MKKLIRGIVDFRKTVRMSRKDTFAKLALGQRPDTLFIVCSDSRVAPNVFASTDPGDLFVIRNVGNMVPPSGKEGLSKGDESVAAAIEFALLNLNVAYIIVCGHSECGAMVALTHGRNHVEAPNLKNWLKHGDVSLKQFNKGYAPFSNKVAEKHNQLSQLNVLQQIEHLKTYPLVQERIKTGMLQLHAWWFDIKEANVYAYNPDEGAYHLIDEAYASELVERISKP
jgi:carbonic anhydrase